MKRQEYRAVSICNTAIGTRSLPDPLFLRIRADKIARWTAALLVSSALVGCSDNDDDAMPLDDDPDGKVSVLNHDNYLEVSGYVLGLFAGKIYEPAIFAGESFVAANEPLSVEVIDPQMNVTRSVYGCGNGGQATITAFYSAAGAGRTLDQQYDNCEWKGHIHDGHVLYQLEPYGRLIWSYDDFVLTSFEGRQVVPEGTVRRGYNQCKVDGFGTWVAELERYEADDTDGSTLLTGVDTEFGYGVECGQPTARLGGLFTVSSPLVGGETLTVHTPADLVNSQSDARRFATGRLEIRASEDNAIVLDTADGDGNDATVAVVLTIDGEDETQSLAWDDWRGEMTFDEDDDQD